MFMTFYLFSANTLARSNNINIDKDVTIAIKAALEKKERKKPLQWLDQPNETPAIVKEQLNRN